MASDPGISVLVTWSQKSLCDLHRSVLASSVPVGEAIYLLLGCHTLSEGSAGDSGYLGHPRDWSWLSRTKTMSSVLVKFLETSRKVR